jgi:hypothetical protein
MMLAKNKEDRYDDINQLLEDLNALKNGQPPVYARENIDISELRQLENGEEIPPEDEYEGYSESTINNYRIALIAVSALCAISILGLIIAIATR